MKRVFQLLPGLLLVLMLAACHAPNQHADTTPRHMQLKTYSVPPQKSEAISHALISTFLNEGLHVSLSVPFPGTILVYAPRDVQAAIGDAIAAVTKAPATVSRPAQLQVHFWVVKAIPGQGSDAPALKPLTAALDRLRTKLGPSHFTLASNAAAIGTLNHKSKILAGPYQFEFVATAGADGSTLLQVQYDSPHMLGKDHGIAHLQTTVVAMPGQYVILAQAPVRSASDTSAQTGKPAATPMRLLVMRVDQMRSSTH